MVQNDNMDPFGNITYLKKIFFFFRTKKVNKSGLICYGVFNIGYNFFTYIEVYLQSFWQIRKEHVWNVNKQFVYFI